MRARACPSSTPAAAIRTTLSTATSMAPCCWGPTWAGTSATASTAAPKARRPSLGRLLARAAPPAEVWNHLVGEELHRRAHLLRIDSRQRQSEGQMRRVLFDLLDLRDRVVRGADHIAVAQGALLARAA